MVFGRYCRQGAPLILAAGIGMALAPVLPAVAQTPPSPPPAYSPWQGIAPPPEAAPDADEDEAPEADKDAEADGKTKDAAIKGLELDWSQLNVDASTLKASPASKARVAPQSAFSTEMSWSANDKANGSSAVTVKQPVSNFLDTRVGADMTVTRPPQTLTESQLLANGGSLPQSSGTAWAAITAPGVGSIWDKTAVEARLDPSQEQSKLGTSLSKSLPLNEQYSLTLQNGYNVTQQGIVPVPGLLAARPLRSYATDQSAKLSLTDTGTSLIAGEQLSSAADRWLHSIGAEQKLFGGVSINGSIGETPLGASNKSLTAGFKQSW
jgi:hypothetical protein